MPRAINPNRGAFSFAFCALQVDPVQATCLAHVCSSVCGCERAVPVPEMCKRSLFTFLAVAAALLQYLGFTHDCCWSDGESVLTHLFNIYVLVSKCCTAPV